MPSLFLIWNPTAGKGDGTTAYKNAVAYLDSHKIPYTAAMTEYVGHATKLAKEAVDAGYEEILILGGDGTIREAASSIIHTDAIMGLLPCGSGNDLVRPLHIPLDINKALDIALNGQIRKMDAGMANNELFFNVAGFGFDVDVLIHDQEFRAKGFKGSFSYLLGVLKSLKHFQLRKTHITFPEGEMDKDVLLIAAANGIAFGGGLTIAPGADPFDGKFNVCVLHDVTKAAVPGLLAKFFSGKHIYTKYCTYFQTTELTAEADPVSTMEVDGEILPGTPVTFKLLPGVIRVRVPSDI